MAWDEGFVLEHRSVMEHAVFQDDWLYRLFRWCIMKANYQPGIFKGEPIPVGSFPTGTDRGAETLHVSRSKFHRGLHKLTKPPYEVISLKVKRDFTIVTVCNYTTYQARKTPDETQMKRQRNADETPAESIEQEQQIKQGNKVKHTRGFTPPSVEEIRAYCSERSNGLDPERFFDHYESKGWRVGQHVMKNWQAAVRNWEKNDRDGLFGAKSKAPRPGVTHDPKASASSTGDPTFGTM